MYTGKCENIEDIYNYTGGLLWMAYCGSVDDKCRGGEGAIQLYDKC